MMNLPEGWPTDEMIEEGRAAYWHWRNDNVDLREKLASAFKAMIAAAPTPPVQEDEPVAEIRSNQGEAIIDLTKILEQSVGTKFYTRPSDDKLQKAAEEVLRRKGDIVDLAQLFVAIDNLRAALEGK